MADNSIRMPSGSGGLTRYSEDYKSKIKIKPAHVIALLIIVIVAEILLKLLWK